MSRVASGEDRMSGGSKMIAFWIVGFGTSVGRCVHAARTRRAPLLMPKRDVALVCRTRANRSVRSVLRTSRQNWGSYGRSMGLSSVGPGVHRRGALGSVTEEGYGPERPRLRRENRWTV